MRGHQIGRRHRQPVFQQEEGDLFEQLPLGLVFQRKTRGRRAIAAGIIVGIGGQAEAKPAPQGALALGRGGDVSGHE